MWTLKPGQPPIEIVDGPFAGQSYLPGASYKLVPPSEENRFEELKPPADTAKAKKSPGKKEK